MGQSQAEPSGEHIGVLLAVASKSRRRNKISEFTGRAALSCATNSGSSVASSGGFRMSLDTSNNNHYGRRGLIV